MANNLPCSKLNLYKTTNINSQEGCRACHILLGQIGGRCYKQPLNHPGWPTSPCRPCKVCPQTDTTNPMRALSRPETDAYLCSLHWHAWALVFFIYQYALTKTKNRVPLLSSKSISCGKQSQASEASRIGTQSLTP